MTLQILHVCCITPFGVISIFSTFFGFVTNLVCTECNICCFKNSEVKSVVWIALRVFFLHFSETSIFRVGGVCIIWIFRPWQSRVLQNESTRHNTCGNRLHIYFPREQREPQFMGSGCGTKLDNQSLLQGRRYNHAKSLCFPHLCPLGWFPHWGNQKVTI